MKTPIQAVSGIVKGKGQVKKITDTFSTQDLYLVFDESYQKSGEMIERESTPKFQFSGKDLLSLEKIQPGDNVYFSWKFTGRKYEKDGKSGHITSLEGWGIKKLVPVVEHGPAVSDAQVIDEVDDLPF